MVLRTCIEQLWKALALLPKGILIVWKEEVIALIGWLLPAVAPRAGYGWKLRRACPIAPFWYLPSRSVGWWDAECSLDALPAFSQAWKKPSRNRFGTKSK